MPKVEETQDFFEEKPVSMVSIDIVVYLKYSHFLRIFRHTGKYNFNYNSIYFPNKKLLIIFTEELSFVFVHFLKKKRN
jgi:hypothetical protein